MINLITHFKCHMTRRILLREKEEQRIDYLYFMSISILEYIRDMKTQSLTSTLIFNMKKSFKSALMEGMKKCVSHDDSWRRINKDLTMTNHTSEKSKREAWHQGTECDREWQVDIWIRGIKLTMENHISLSINLYWIIKKRWHGQEVKSWSYNVRIHYHRLKADLFKSRSCWHPQALIKMKSDKEENQIDKLKIIHKCFYLLLEYRLSYYEERCNMVFLKKTKCSKPKEIPRVS
jgi:hypothetical protein